MHANRVCPLEDKDAGQDARTIAFAAAIARLKASAVDRKASSHEQG